MWKRGLYGIFGKELEDGRLPNLAPLLQCCSGRAISGIGLPHFRISVKYTSGIRCSSRIKICANYLNEFRYGRQDSDFALSCINS